MIADMILTGCLFAALAFAVGLCLCASYMLLKEKEIFTGVGFAGMGLLLLILTAGLAALFIERGICG